MGDRVTLALTIAGQTRVSIAQEHLVGKRQFKFPGLEVAERTALKRAAALFGLHSDADGNLTWQGSETVNEDTGEITRRSAPQVWLCRQ